ncbi:hypothetical protein ACFSL6_25590 [Paenibacillus thailandensis]|uniref:VanZ-like domain-containing protein n=1 Tax=Paenibacillus thailandensis TaxID=393250 RepID=A0ABW5QV51_9BACL
MHIVNHLILWAVFVVLFTAGVTALEVAEGYKITTTEYYGLRNIGGTFIVMFLLAAFLFYPFTLFPFALLIRKLYKRLLPRIVVYVALGGFGGLLLFDFIYKEDFVVEYGLHESSAVILCGLIGLIYSCCEHFVYRKPFL